MQGSDPVRPSSDDPLVAQFVRLRRSQRVRLRLHAARMRVSIAELVRMLLDERLNACEEASQRDPETAENRGENGRKSG